MRPLRLTMQAFGSYGKRTVIDFEQTNQNLFLITGTRELERRPYLTLLYSPSTGRQAPG